MATYKMVSHEVDGTVICPLIKVSLFKSRKSDTHWYLTASGVSISPTFLLQQDEKPFLANGIHQTVHRFGGFQLKN